MKSTEENSASNDLGLVPDATLKIISNVYKKCLHEKAKKELRYPLEDVELRASCYTGFTLEYINQVITDNILTSINAFPVAISHRIEIYEACSLIYQSDFLNSQHFLQMYKQFKKSYQNISPAVFQRMLNLMKYKLMKTKLGDKCFIEDAHSSNERFIYLKTIKSMYEENKNIFYVDARYMDLKKNFMKPWAEGLTIENSEELTCGYIFYHIMSAEGYLCGITCAQLCYDDFYNWMYNMVLPKLPPNSTIVMDKSEYHGKFVKNYISPYESKAHLMEKLQKYHIPVSLKMHKSELYELAVKHVPPVEHKCEIDEVFKSHGHIVLRLPHTLYDLSMTDLFWEETSQVYKKRDIQSIQNLNAAVIMTLDYEYDPAKWTRLKSKVQKFVKKLYEIEVLTDTAIGKYSFCNTRYIDASVPKRRVVNADEPIVVS